MDDVVALHQKILVSVGASKDRPETKKISLALICNARPKKNVYKSGKTSKRAAITASTSLILSSANKVGPL